MGEALDFVEPRIERIPETGCWIWMGGISQKGYARASYDGRDIYLHRWLYQQIYGDVGELTMDHLCRVRCCINPAHLEPVTNIENVLRGFGEPAKNRRKTHCKHGHPFDEENTRKQRPETKEKTRVCKTCARLLSNKIYHQRKNNEIRNV